MLNPSTRRWLAGLGVAGALVAASATPAVAAPAPFELITQDLLVAPDHSAYSYLFAGSTDPDDVPPRFGHTTLDIDFSGISGFATVEQPGEGTEWACELSATKLHCETDVPEDEAPAFDFQVTGSSGAALESEGQLKYAMTAGGRTVNATSTVTIAEGVDLQAPETAELSGAPGARVGIPSVVQVGSEGPSSDGAVLMLNGSYRSHYAGTYSNCVESEFVDAVCTFDEQLSPGRTYRLSEPVPFTIDKDARTGSQLPAASVWWTRADWELASRDLPVSKPVQGPKLRLVEVTGGKASVKQTDINTNNDFTDITITVTGDNRADLAAVGATAKGAKGATVEVEPGLTNLGPAGLEFREQPVFRVSIPEGTTAVEVPGECQPYTSDDAWDPWNGNWAEPGAREYGCLASPTPKGARYPYPFRLRIDKVVPDASGAVAVRLEGDPNSKNDTAKLVINPTGVGGGEGDGQGGGDGGTLPITGSSTALIAGLGGLLLVAGVGGYLVARRRRTRFVA